MDSILTNLETIFNAAIAAGDIDLRHVQVGYDERPENIPVENYPFLAIDDAGEYVDDKVGGSTAQLRIYQVMLEIGCIKSTLSDAVKKIITISNDMKTILELEANRQKDGHQWGVSITPIAMSDDAQGVYRGRRVIVNFFDLEDKYQDY